MSGRGLRRGLAGMAAVMIALSGAMAESETEERSESTAAENVSETSAGSETETATVTRIGDWELDEKGFLVSGAGAAYILEDEKNGKWQYASRDLAMTIQRFREEVAGKNKKTRTREYCVADIHTSPRSPLGVAMSEATSKRPAGYKLVSPETLINLYPAILAISDDMYGIRLHKYKYDGVVIRNGEILARKTRDSSKKRPWPNLDTLALFADGSMKTYVCDAMTPEEYLALGATQVFSFGPVLISEGVINEKVLDPNYYPYNEPRMAIGMVEPWHYIVIAVRGRPEKTYVGAHLDWVAEKMLEYGCVEALNLDGGLTVTMSFMGKLILTGGSNLRSQGSMIVFGGTGEP